MDLFEENIAGYSKEISRNFAVHNLESKIVKVFGKNIKFFSIKNKKLVSPKHRNWGLARRR